jgi:hypothetical protein
MGVLRDVVVVPPQSRTIVNFSEEPRGIHRVGAKPRTLPD